MISFITICQQTNLNVSDLTLSTDGIYYYNGVQHFVEDGIVYLITYTNIEELKVGDLVLAYDDKQGKNIVSRVKDEIVKQTTLLAKVTLSDGTVIEMSQYHPLYTSVGWRSLTNYHGYGTLLVGHMVLTNQGYKEIVNIETWIADVNLTLYNLGLEDLNGEYQGYLAFYANNTVAQAPVYDEDEEGEEDENTEE